MEARIMTDQQLNRALAELMGYTVYHREDLGLDCYRLTDPLGIAVQGFFNGQRDTEAEAWLDIPHFCSDPAASLEVQAKAIEVDYFNYFTNLLTLKGVLLSPSILDAYKAIALASPRERAEAAYITLKGANL